MTQGLSRDHREQCRKRIIHTMSSDTDVSARVREPHERTSHSVSDAEPNMKKVRFALPRMRRLAFWPTTPLSPVMSPYSSTTTTSQRPLKFSTRSPPARAGLRACMTRRSVTTPSTERSLHHCSPRSEKIQRAMDKLITLLTKVCCQVSRRLSVMLEHGRLVSDEFGSLISNVRENPRRDSENEQIRILLERQKEQTLADYRAEIQSRVPGRL